MTQPKENRFEQLGFKMGYKKDTHDPRDHINQLPPLDQLPKFPHKFDLKHKIKTIFKQKWNDCSSNVISNCVMSLKKDDKPVSRLFQYFNSRFIQDPDFITDSGVSYRDALKALQRFGFVDEEEWDYIDKHLYMPPTENIYNMADKNKFFIKSYRKLYPSKLNIKYNLFCSENLIMFGIAIYDNFLNLDNNFVVPMPEKKSTFEGLHAVILCGWDDDLHAFLCLNSWGDNFGDNGFFYLPYDFVSNEELSMDFWAIYTNFEYI